MKNAVVLGLGISGKAVAEYLLNEGCTVYGVDRRANELVNDLQIKNMLARGMLLFCEEDTSILPKNWEALILSPGIPGNHPLCVCAEKQGIPVIGEAEFASRLLKNPCIGITGTNGKTTVSLLIGHILNQSGIPARVVGNVGVPLVSEVLKNVTDVLVIELSSYQLETMETRILDAAAILNITPDHLDRYDSFESYANAKLRIERVLKDDASLFIGKDVADRFTFSEGHIKVYGFDSQSCDVYCKQGTIINEDVEYILPVEYKDKIDHNVENCIVVWAICHEWGVTSEQFTAALETFVKPPHRIEFVKKVRGVAFYDDSKGTNVDAVKRAVESLQGDIILIAGGVDKGSSYRVWLEPFKGRVSYIIAIGEAAEKIKSEMEKAYDVEIVEDLAVAVRRSHERAKEGDCVLLSPGCASFDMFKNYAHRGETFKRLVEQL